MLFLNLQLCLVRCKQRYCSRSILFIPNRDKFIFIFRD
jgi:hypothetical protein